MLHPVLGFTFRRVFRRLDIALLQTLRYERVRLLYIFLSLFLSLALRALRCSLPLFHAFITARYRHICVLRFCAFPPLPFVFPSRKPLSPSLSSILFYPLLSSFILRPSFDLTRPDRPVHVYSRNNYIQPGSFFVRPFLRSLKTNWLIVKPCPAVRNCPRVPVCEYFCQIEHRVKYVASFFSPVVYAATCETLSKSYFSCWPAWVISYSYCQANDSGEAIDRP